MKWVFLNFYRNCRKQRNYWIVELWIPDKLKVLVAYSY